MARAEELGGRRTPTQPKPKSEKTVTFVNDAGEELEVVTSISKGEQLLLKRRGYTRKGSARKTEDETPPKE